LSLSLHYGAAPNSVSLRQSAASHPAAPTVSDQPLLRTPFLATEPFQRRASAPLPSLRGVSYRPSWSTTACSPPLREAGVPRTGSRPARDPDPIEHIYRLLERFGVTDDRDRLQLGDIVRNVTARGSAGLSLYTPIPSQPRNVPGSMLLQALLHPLNQLLLPHTLATNPKPAHPFSPHPLAAAVR
jgi:hypothetical protein